MNMYFIQNESISPPQDLLLEHLLPVSSKQAVKHHGSKSPKEVASVIASKLMQLVETRLELTENR